MGPTCDAGTAGRRGVSVLALRRMAVWAMCFMRPPCCLTKCAHPWGNFRITFAAGGRRKGRVRVSSCGSPDWWVDGGIHSSWELEQVR